MGIKHHVQDETFLTLFLNDNSKDACPPNTEH